MTKLEDKLIASVKQASDSKPVQKQTVAAKKASKTKQGAAATGSKKITGKKVASKPKPARKQDNAERSTNQSILHPQRIWPD